MGPGSGGKWPPPRLTEVDEIERPPSGKYQDFTSDFEPGLGSNALPDPSVSRQP
jgi:hypothetical protein